MTIRKKILLGLLFCTIIFGSYFISQFLYKLDKTLVNISAQPDTSKISINGSIINHGEIYLKPGKYQISISKDGYYEYRKTYEISNQTVNISAVLNPEPDKKLYYLIHSDQYNNVIAKYPIINKLPYDNFLIKIDYSDDSTLNSLKLSVKSYEGYRQAVITKIKQWGYNPAEFNIEFKDYENPFKL